MEKAETGLSVNIFKKNEIKYVCLSVNIETLVNSV